MAKKTLTVETLENYKRIQKLRDEGKTILEIAKEFDLDQRRIYQIINDGKKYYAETELLNFSQSSPRVQKAFNELDLENKLDAVVKALPNRKYYMTSVDASVQQLNLSKNVMNYLRALDDALEVDKYSKLKLRYLNYFHNSWLDLYAKSNSLIWKDNKRVKPPDTVPTDEGQESWMYLLAGLDTLKEIFIDKNISELLTGLYNHIMAYRPWYDLKTWNELDEIGTGLTFSQKIKRFMQFNPDIPEYEVIAATKRIQSYLPKARTYCERIHEELDKIITDLHIVHAIEFKELFKLVIPIPVSLSKAKNFRDQDMEIDILKFFSIEILKLSIFNSFRLISKDAISIDEEEFERRYCPKINEYWSKDHGRNEENHGYWIGYLKWCRKNSIKDFEKFKSKKIKKG
tara:strand:- start:126 stop:1328 length:1203 start_codon:yes stop_codon:yes gene_type:complete